MGTVRMGKQRSEREREALCRFSRALAEETRGGHLEEALESILSVLGEEAGTAFSVDGSFLNVVAERGIGADGSNPPRQGDAVRDALMAIATRAATSRKAIHLSDLGRSELPSAQLTELLRRGIASVVAQPVKHQREVLGVLIVLAKDAASFDTSG